MSKRLIISFLILTSLIILLIGVYRVYNLFYNSYFSSTSYTQIAFIGNKEIPTKTEILFSGFKSLKVITISSIISIVAIYSKKMLNRN